MGALRKCVDGIGEVSAAGPESGAFEKWQRDTRVAIGRVFKDVEHVKEFEHVSFGPNRVLDVHDPRGSERALREGLEQGLAKCAFRSP